MPLLLLVLVLPLTTRNKWMQLGCFRCFQAVTVFSTHRHRTTRHYYMYPG
jgi:hypothetical protein